jgi:hypothetical protein
MKSCSQDRRCSKFLKEKIGEACEELEERKKKGSQRNTEDNEVVQRYFSEH